MLEFITDAIVAIFFGSISMMAGCAYRNYRKATTRFCAEADAVLEQLQFWVRESNRLECEALAAVAEGDFEEAERLLAQWKTATVRFRMERRRFPTPPELTL